MNNNRAYPVYLVKKTRYLLHELARPTPSYTDLVSNVNMNRSAGGEHNVHELQGESLLDMNPTAGTALDGYTCLGSAKTPFTYSLSTYLK
jgi:hypothetical protein